MRWVIGDHLSRWVTPPAALVTTFEDDSGGGDQPVHTQYCNVSKQASPLGTWRMAVSSRYLHGH